MSFNLDFTILDFETSGLDYQTEQIIEASVIRVRDGVPVMTFNTLVKLREGKKLAQAVTDLTGHREEDLQLALDEEELAGILANMIGEYELLIAHNALFDMSFLNKLFEGAGYASVTNPFIDTLTIARAREPFPHKLENICKRNGIVLDDAHSAEADTFALLEVVLKYHRDKDISEWINVAGYRPKYGEPSWYPEGTVLKKQGSEVVQHGMKKAPLRPGNIKSPAISPRQKKIPSKAETLSDEDMPTALLPKYAKEKIDEHLLAGKEFFEVSGHVNEFDSVMAYLIEVCKIPEKDIYSSLDNPEEFIIEVTNPPYNARRESGKCTNCNGTGYVSDGMHATFQCSVCHGTGKASHQK
jgi:DNA polymerase-3 subunit epsilon